MEKEYLGQLGTERSNPKSKGMDRMSPMELMDLMNREDEKVVQAVHEALPEMERAVRRIIPALQKGGRLIYMGAGTSGRIGVMDAVECVPTFSTTDEVIAVMAGGEDAFVRAREGAEDSEQLAAEDLDKIRLGKDDVILALTASGRTPYCIGALKEGRKRGAACISLSCNRNAVISGYADIAIEVDAGPEVLTGSTRLKAGSCQKMILNMISTAVMTGMGKVYENYMVDMKATNHKLENRAKRIVMEVTGCPEEQAVRALQNEGKSIKKAIVMILAGITEEEAEKRLCREKGMIRQCI